MELREKIATVLIEQGFEGFEEAYPMADAILQIPEIKEALRRSEYARHAALCNLNQPYDTAEGLKSACVCSCGLDD